MAPNNLMIDYNQLFIRIKIHIAKFSDSSTKYQIQALISNQQYNNR